MFVWIRTVFQRIRALFAARRLDKDFDQEVLSHISLAEEENIRRGMTPQEAHYAALRSFGGVAQVKERNREKRGLRDLEILFQDLRYALFTLRKKPGFAAVAIITLALGIGANTAIFQLLNAVRIRSLPVKNPQELMEVKPTRAEDRRGSINRFGTLTYAIWEQIRINQQAFSGIFAWGESQFNLGNGGQARYARAMMVSGDFFNVLGVRAQLGRLLTLNDDQKGCGAPVAVVSDTFWQREFGGRASVIGAKLSLDSHPVEIVGVTPASFFGFEIGQNYDLALPICAEAVLRGENSRLDNGLSWWLVAVGRLKPDWSIDRANAELAAISPRVFQAALPANYPVDSIKNYLAFKLAAYPAAGGVSQLRNDYSDSLWLLLGASGLVLLIACANLANLMLARGSARQREIAVRLALGASRGRLLRQFLTESLLLAALGALFGLWLARGLSAVLISLLTINGNPVFLDLKPDWRVQGFNVGLAILTCLLFGITPALRSTRTDPGLALRFGIYANTAAGERFGLRRILVVAQISLSLILVAGALLFSRSLAKLLTLDPGFSQSGVLLTTLNLESLHIPEDGRIAFKQRLVDRLETLPGVDSAALAEMIPISGDSWSNPVWVDGADASQRTECLFNRVGADYFKALGIPLLAGRAFDTRDTAAGPKVAIVNEAFARRFTNGANPVRMRVWRQPASKRPDAHYEIVGLARNTKYIDMREDFRPIVYLPSSQDPQPDASAQVVIRSRLPLAAVLSPVKHVVAEVNPEIVIDFDNLKNVVASSLLRERLIATLSGFFGFLGAVLASIGLYGVLSYIVARRTNEIGIRMALGADRGRVVRLIMREGTLLVAIGLAIGGTLALALGKAVGSLLYGLTPRDPITLFGAGALLALVGLLASHMPARRASRLDPLVALREQ